MEAFEAYVSEACNQPIAGWNFATLDGRFVDGQLPWSYTSTVLPLIRQTASMLDLDTGGGEFLARLPVRAPYTKATEGHAPNIELARARLAPLGVTVSAIDRSTNRLPFGDAAFDLVLGRHAGFDWTEVFRVLRHDGVFVTQQVGSDNHHDINERLGPPPMSGTGEWTLDIARAAAETAGFEILRAAEAYRTDKIFDIAALIIQLRLVPWQIPDFSIDRYRDRLREIHDAIAHNGYLEVTGHRFLLVARKP